MADEDAMTAAPLDEIDARTEPLSATMLVARERPVVLRGLAADWPIVRDGDAAGYLRRLGGGASVEVAVGPPEISGKLFYNPAMSGLNFVRETTTLAALEEGLAVYTVTSPDLSENTVFDELL